MKLNKAILSLLALTLLVGAFLFPAAAYAQAGDTTPPTVTVEIRGDMLKATAKDDTGVASIYINGTRFSTLVNGTANVRIKDYAGEGKQIEVYATDIAGNKSQSILLDNPYYKEPAQQPTPTPTQTIAPTPTPAVTNTPVLSPEPSVSPAPTLPVPEAQPPSPQPGQTGSATPNGPNALTPDGGGTVMDNATEQEGKEFFTVTATDGSVYYLIIDRQRGTQNVYFLSAVTREDLVGLTDGGATTAPGLNQPESQTPETPAPTQQPEPTAPPEQNSGGMGAGTIIFILVAVAIVGAAGYYLKIVKPRKDSAQADEYEDYEDDLGEESAVDEYFFDESDEYHPNELDRNA